ncbi:MAG: YkgJ family cysteine cluster protein [Vicinamibacterales bacterium]
MSRLEVFLSSRNAGLDLTTDRLERGWTRDAAVDAAAAVSDFIDEAIDVVRDEYQPSIACTVGCDHCCCKPGVLVTWPELLRILDHVERTFSKADVRRLHQRAFEYSALLDGRNPNDPVDEPIPCPLLNEGRCSVYDVRPATCRGYNSTDASACRAARVNHRVLVPIAAIVKDASDGATLGAVQALDALGMKSSMIDLGSALNAVGARVDAAVSAAADGRLAAAEMETWAQALWDAVTMTAQQCGVEV